MSKLPIVRNDQIIAVIDSLDSPTTSAISERLGYCLEYTRKRLKQMSSKKLVHIATWGLFGHSREAVWCSGVGVNAPRPDRMTQAERDKRRPLALARSQPKWIFGPRPNGEETRTLSVIAACAQQPRTREELATLCGISRAYAGTVVASAWKVYGLLYIHDYTPRMQNRKRVPRFALQLVPFEKPDAQLK